MIEDIKGIKVRVILKNNVSAEGIVTEFTEQFLVLGNSKNRNLFIINAPRENIMFLEVFLEEEEQLPVKEIEKFEEEKIEPEGASIEERIDSAIEKKNLLKKKMRDKMNKFVEGIPSSINKDNFTNKNYENPYAILSTIGNSAEKTS